VGLKRFKILHGLGFCLFFAQLAGAFEVAAMQQPKFYLCTHTKQRIEKGKPCPCGCDKRLKDLARARLLSAEHPCANEADGAELPAFARWVFIPSAVGASSILSRMSPIYERPFSYVSHFSEVESPPPRLV